MRNRAIWLKNWCPHVLSKKWLYNMCERLRESSQKVFEQSTIKDEDWQNARKNGKIPRRCWGFLKLALETKHEELDVTAPHKDFDKERSSKEEGGGLGLDGDLGLGRDHTLEGDIVISGDFVGKTRRSFLEWKWDGDLVPHHCNKIVILDLEDGSFWCSFVWTM